MTSPNGAYDINGSIGDCDVRTDGSDPVVYACFRMDACGLDLRIGTLPSAKAATTKHGDKGVDPTTNFDRSNNQQQ